MNKHFENNHLKNIVIVLLLCFLILLILDTGCNFDFAKDFIKEMILVVGAAFVIHAYFEYYLRRQISDEFNKLIEMKEEFGKAGIIKYFTSFKEVNIRSFYLTTVKNIDIYVTYADTYFSEYEEVIEKFCKRDGTTLNVYLLHPNNEFVKPLGNLWGKTDPKYNPDGIKSKIRSTSMLLKNMFDRLAADKALKTKAKVYYLKRHPVFYSFHRFDDEMIYVPSKLIETKSFVPLSFLVKKTANSEGIYNKCLFELENIKNDANSLELFCEYN